MPGGRHIPSPAGSRPSARGPTTVKLPLHLIVSKYHSPEVARERYRLIISRAQAIAKLLALLTVLWIGIDLVSADRRVWSALAVERIAAAIAFLLLSRHRFAEASTRDARGAVAALVGIAIAFFLVSNATLRQGGADDHSLFVTTAYLYSPFLVAAGLSIFPLLAAESVAVALPTIVATALAIALRPELLSPASAAAALLLLALIAGIAALASMSQLQFLIDVTEQSARDGVTRALTRKYGEQVLDLHLAAAQRSKSPLSVLFIDLDNFKRVNDRFGHEVGDKILRRVAQSLHETLRRQDSVIRWGGEEFLIVLPETDSAGATNAIERLASAALALLPDGTLQKASIGVAERLRDGICEWPDLASLADARMYKAKQAGRNRYVGCDERPMPFIKTDSSAAAQDEAALAERHAA
jgi:diguanylate cyclase (GGDEF)-like protein